MSDRFELIHRHKSIEKHNRSAQIGEKLAQDRNVKNWIASTGASMRDLLTGMIDSTVIEYRPTMRNDLSRVLSILSQLFCNECRVF